MSVTILIGDVRERLRELPADHFDCVVTSPPYWGLRDYGVASQIGLEPTLGAHIGVMVDVFREVRRVLKPSGTVWLNYGDCYATTPNGRAAAATKALNGDDRTFRDKPMSTVGPVFQADVTGQYARVGQSDNLGNGADGRANGRVAAGGYLKPKDLVMVPNRLAIALQDDGWWVRSEIIWGKPNGMPDSSGRFRPATAHEKIFLLAKADRSDKPDWWVARDTGEVSDAPDLSEMVLAVTTSKPVKRWIGLGHYYNAAAVRQERAGDEDANGFRGGSYVNGKPGPRQAKGNKRVKMPDSWNTGPGGHGSFHPEGRQKGGYVERPVGGPKSGARAFGLTGAPHGRHALGDAIPEAERRNKQRGHSRRHQGFNERWDQMSHAEQTANGRLLRNYEPAPMQVWEIATAAFKDAHFATFPPELVARALRAGCPPGGRVLDPFGGSGTTGLVCDQMGLSCTLIELNEDYADIARKRIDVGLVRRAQVAPKNVAAPADQASIFAAE